ncbi:MAG: tetratricopeptide repeat protein [Bacteroidales bacterium]|nr:tetratricopeptide repeat protein [Bacteroidales bacterium]
MKILKKILFVLIIVALYSCQSSKDKAIKRIKKTEKIVYSNTTGDIDKNAMNELIKMYSDYVDDYPDDSLSPDFLFKAADYLMYANKPAQSLKFFDKIMKDYPDYSKAPQCLFLKGYIYENFYKDLNKAKEIYISFINKYPDNDFADDAQASLNNLGKSPEDLIKEFEAKAKKQKK